MQNITTTKRINNIRSPYATKSIS